MRTIYSTILLLLISTISYGQTAESIMKKYTKKSGGQKNWDQVSSFKVKGVAKLISQGGMELPFDRYMTKDGKQFTTLKVSGMDYISTAYDGKTVWGSNQQMQPEEKDPDIAKNTILQKYDFPYRGHNWKENGYKVEYEGKVTLEGKEGYKIKLIKRPQWANGKEIENIVYIYFDTKTYLPFYQETKVYSGPNKGKMMKSYMTNYKTVDGLMYPFTVTMKYDDDVSQILEAKEVTWNAKIDNTIFSMPKKD